MEKLTNEDLYSIKQAITNVKDLGTNKFKLPLILLEIELDKHIKALDELREPTEEFKKYDEQKKQKIAAASEQNADGTLVLYEFPEGRGKVVGNGYPKIVGNIKVLEKELKKLDSDFKEEIEKHTKKVTKWQELLSDESTIEVKPVPYALFPEMSYFDLKVLLKVSDGIE